MSDRVTYDDHPIFNPHEFFIETPMMEDLYNTVLEWISYGFTGGAVLGSFRAGKTRAIGYLKERLMTRTGKLIPVHHVTIPRRDSHTINTVHRLVSRAIGLNDRPKDSSSTIATNIITFLVDSATTSHCKSVVLVVDEWHRLNVKQIEAFAELHDELALFKIHLFVLFVGNREASLTLLNQISPEDPEDNEFELIRGRFFLRFYEFFGIRNISELRRCLSQYDHKIFPDEDGMPTTEFFLPDPYAQGWRMSKLAEVMWDTYQTEFASHSPSKSWPMQYFIAASNALILDYLPSCDLDDEEQLYSVITQSIQYSGYVREQVRAL